MSLTALPQLVYNDLLAELIKTLGVMDMNYPDGSVVMVGAPYTKTQLGQRLQDADYEIRVKICKTEDNPHRAKYFDNAEVTDWLADGAFIPERVGNHSQILIKTNTAAADNTAKKGKLAKNVSAVERVQDNPTIYGSPVYLYYIHAGRILLGKTDAVARFDVPKLLITNNTLYSPYEYKWGVLALAITKCFYPGTNETHRKYWADVWSSYEAEIEDRAMDLPEPEQLKRIGA